MLTVKSQPMALQHLQLYKQVQLFWKGRFNLPKYSFGEYMNCKSSLGEYRLRNIICIFGRHCNMALQHLQSHQQVFFSRKGRLKMTKYLFVKYFNFQKSFGEEYLTFQECQNSSGNISVDKVFFWGMFKLSRNLNMRRGRKEIEDK